MSNNVETEQKGQLMYCKRCGRLLYEYVHGNSKRMGCKNTHCLNYLPKSKFLSDEELRAVRK